MSSATVAPINALVERLRAERGLVVPKVSRLHGGVDAPILSVLSDPGPKTEVTGVLCTNNPDPTSTMQRDLMRRVGLRKSHLCPWNAYPWQNARSALTPQDVAQGAVVLAEVINMMTNLRVLLLQGSRAQWAWGMVEAFRPELRGLEFEVVETVHPLGTRGRDAEEVRAKKDAQLRAWQRVAEIVHRVSR